MFDFFSYKSDNLIDVIDKRSVVRLLNVLDSDIWSLRGIRILDINCCDGVIINECYRRLLCAGCNPEYAQSRIYAVLASDSLENKVRVEIPSGVHTLTREYNAAKYVLDEMQFDVVTGIISSDKDIFIDMALKVSRKYVVLRCGDNIFYKCL